MIAVEAAFVVAIGLGACLLFQIQFLLARQILPWFGGAPAVWSTSLVVFQTLLLAGYAWAHGIARLRSRRRQVVVHVGLLTTALALLAWRALVWPSPVSPDDSWRPQDVTAPITAITLLLVVAVGVPFLVLASASPLLQRWRADLGSDASPYRLYAVSNAGSLAGLLTYPVLVEPHLDLRQQGLWWTLAFVAFGGALALCAWRVWGERDGPFGARALPTGPSAGTATERPWHAGVAVWLVLAAVPSALLQATTTRLTQDIAAVPFLWMVPLALYLISFIVAFERPAACPLARLAQVIVVAAIASLAPWAMPVQLGLTLLLLLVAGLALHGELARRAPDPQGLTRYYLVIAAGGVLGSALVGFGAPLVFTRVIEYPLTVAATLLVLAVHLFSQARHRPPVARRRTRLLAEAQVLAGLVLLAATAADARLVAGQTTHASRNFFGTVRVRELALPDGAAYRRFIHGSTLHGVQWLAPDRRREPTAYFTSSSGVGRAMAMVKARRAAMRVAVIGLGIGTLAAYGRPGDTYTFYEIDPQVVALSEGAQPPFTFIRDSPAHIDIVVGDGRLALERTPPLGVDLLAMDAFSSDAVPVHLVTREALAAYARHLRDDRSLIAVNVANRYLDLAGIVTAAGREQGFHAVLVEGDAGPGLVQATRWLLLSRSADALQPLGRPHVSREAPWTDAFSAPWRAIRW